MKAVILDMHLTTDLTALLYFLMLDIVLCVLLGIYQGWHMALRTFACSSLSFPKIYIFVLQSAEML